MSKRFDIIDEHNGTLTIETDSGTSVISRDRLRKLMRSPHTPDVVKQGLERWNKKLLASSAAPSQVH